MSESLSERLDALLADLPEDAWSITHHAEAGYRVCTIVIDWRRIPGETGSRLARTGKLRRSPEPGTAQAGERHG